jgi:5-methylthioadenosine/S-adenosylhomocysteine deaminase
VSLPERHWWPLTGSRNAARGAPALVGLTRTGPIDPMTGPTLALAGRVVTMDDAFTIKDDAIVYIDKGRIVAVQDRAAPAPPPFGGVTPVETGGTLFPGLIDLHNHLSYNVLPLWAPVPKRFTDRGQWPGHPDYRKLITGPMTVLGEYRDADGQPSLVSALVRYVECKCLMGGITTSQGIRLASNAGIQRFYRGVVRNVEQTDDADLPEAQARIPDVAAKDARAFLGRLQKEDSCFLLHLSEGVTTPGAGTSPARRHFLALEVAPSQWAINNRLTAIHAAGLLPDDFEVLGSHQGRMVWSPLSNLLLYGQTARVEAAKAAGVPIGLGADWSPSGSKNLLGELKVAWLYNQHGLNALFSTRDLVAMATRVAARLLKWDTALGTIEAGKRADILVVDGVAGDPYDALIRAKETSIRLVVVNGVARYGTPEVMAKLAPPDQTVRVGGKTRRLFLRQETADPAVAAISLRTATTRLRTALRDLKKLARDLERPRAPKGRTSRALDAATPPVWTLALDEIRETGVELRPRLPLTGPRDFTGPVTIARRPATRARELLSDIVEPVTLDPLTVVDDDDFLTQIAAQPNLPQPIKEGLALLY